MADVICKQCGGAMHETKKTESSIGLQLFGVLLFFVGIALLFVFPFGTIAGVMLMIFSARLGYKRIRITLCEKCGYFFERI
jgi:ABC-type phosphate transport system permease subunit